jgi:hypothetical protein
VNLHDYSTDELIDELKRRQAGDVCLCGPSRKEVIRHEDSPIFYPQTGCLTCDRWDSPPRSKPR